MIPLLSLSGVDAFYGASQALFGMSLDIEPGAFVTLLGRNGMGKSTTVKAVVGLVGCAEIWSCLGQLKLTGLSILCIDKNLTPMLALGHHHYIVDKWRVAWHGDSAALLGDLDRLQTYLGV